MNKFNKKLQFLLLCISICYIKLNFAASIAGLDANDYTPNTPIATTENDQAKKDSQDKFINVIMKQHAETTAVNEGDNVRLIYQDNFSNKENITGILWLYAKLNSKYIKHALAGVSYPENKAFIYSYPKITHGNAYDFNSYPVDSKRFFANLTALELKNVTQNSLGKFIHHIRMVGEEDTETFAELALLKPEVTTNSYSIAYSTTNNPLAIHTLPIDSFSYSTTSVFTILGGVIVGSIAVGCFVYKYCKPSYYKSNKFTTDKNPLTKEEDIPSSEKNLFSEKHCPDNDEYLNGFSNKVNIFI